MVIAETERLLLREVQDEDSAVFVAMHAHPEVMRFSVEQRPLTADETAVLLQWIQSTYTTQGYGLWAVVDKAREQVIGYSGFTYYDIDGREETELGYRFVPDAWGQGFATEAAGACLQLAWDQLQLQRVISIIEPANTASIRVAEKLGFQYERSLQLYTIPIDIYVVERHGKKGLLGA